MFIVYEFRGCPSLSKICILSVFEIPKFFQRFFYYFHKRKILAAKFPFKTLNYEKGAHYLNFPILS